MAAKKTTTKKKTTAKKTPARKPVAKKKTAKKPAAKKSAPKKAAAAPKASKPARAGKGGVSSASVNLAHVFALRPRMQTSFKPGDFIRAKQLLSEEEYASIEEAARAVAAKALSMTHDGPPKRFNR